MQQKICYHGVTLFNDKVLYAGGQTSLRAGTTLDSVILYDIKKNECTQMPRLPFPVSEMETACWGDNAILVGGCNEDGDEIDAVVAYDSKTGVCKMLPSMNNKNYLRRIIKNRDVQPLSEKM